MDTPVPDRQPAGPAAGRISIAKAPLPVCRIWPQLCRPVSKPRIILRKRFLFRLRIEREDLHDHLYQAVKYVD
jgi:hypothetical protein